MNSTSTACRCWHGASTPAPPSRLPRWLSAGSSRCAGRYASPPVSLFRLAWRRVGRFWCGDYPAGREVCRGPARCRRPSLSPQQKDRQGRPSLPLGCIFRISKGGSDQNLSDDVERSQSLQTPSATIWLLIHGLNSWLIGRSYLDFRILAFQDSLSLACRSCDLAG